jgi:beta-lactam-binding protein with PASTA domain
VPSLIGLSLEEAKKSLSESGLNLGNLNYIENETFMPNTVINQNPSPGALVKNLSNVNLTLSR